MPLDDDIDAGSLVRTSPNRPGRSHRARAVTRAAMAAAALLLLFLALAPRAGAAVYWSDSGFPGTIGRANLDGTGVNDSFIGGPSDPSGVAVDRAHIYWTDLSTGTIGRANLDGTDADQNFITGANAPVGVAVDGAHIYWTNVDSVQGRVGGSIGRANLDGTGVDQSFIPGAATPNGVAVDGAHVFWTNADGHTIGRANLDGTGADQSFIGGLGSASAPCGVAVDGAHVYWADIAGNVIGRANLNGTAVNQSFLDGIGSPCGVAVDSAHLYWTHIDAIGRANLDGTGADPTFITGIFSSLGVAVDADAQPARISVGDVSLAEGNAGQTAFRFTASLDAPQSAPVTVDFATADGTATAPSDYAAATGTVTFAPGETAETVTVQVNGDTAVETDETFIVDLSNPTGNATIADGRAAGTIVNDDQPVVTPPSRIAIADVSMAEGNTGQTAFRFTTSLDTPQPVPVTVDFATSDGSATAPSDYAAGSGTVTFAPGDTSEPVTVQVNGDTTKETDETFNVNLSSATGNATIADGHAVGTIANDDRRGRPHKFKLGNARPNRNTGTARLAVVVPGPGKLAISGNGVKAVRAVVVASSISPAGVVQLPVNASGQKQRTLNRTGTVTVMPRVTYTPTGGKPRTRSKAVRLDKR